MNFWPRTFPKEFPNRSPGDFGNQSVGSFLTPLQFGNQTGHWDSSLWATKLYTDAGVTLCAAENDLVYRRADISGNNRNQDQGTAGFRGLLKFNVQNGLAGVLMDGTDDLYNTTASIATFFTPTVKVAFAVFKVVTIGTDNALVYNNDGVFYDSGGYMGLTMRSSSPMYAYNYGGSVDAAASTIANGEAGVVAYWQTGGNLYISKNNGTAVSTASGATSVTTGTLNFGAAGVNKANIYLLEESFHNVYAGDAQRQSVVAGLMAKWGIT